MDETIQYRFNEPHALYLRLIPTASLPQEQTIGTLLGAARAKGGGTFIVRPPLPIVVSQNTYGVAAYQPVGSNTVPMALTQLFQNGEIWTVSKDMVQTAYEGKVLPIVNLINSFSKALRGIGEMVPELDLTPPFKIELGAVGLTGVRLAVPPPWYATSGEFFQDSASLIKVVNGLTDKIIGEIVEAFVRKLCDLAGCDESFIPPPILPSSHFT